MAGVGRLAQRMVVVAAQEKLGALGAGMLCPPGVTLGADGDNILIVALRCVPGRRREGGGWGKSAPGTTTLFKSSFKGRQQMSLTGADSCFVSFLTLYLSYQKLTLTKSYLNTDRGTIALTQHNGSAHVEFTPPRQRKALALATDASALWGMLRPTNKPQVIAGGPIGPRPQPDYNVPYFV